MQAQNKITRALSYKLKRTVSYKSLNLLFSRGAMGTIGSNAPVVVSGSASEFQVMLTAQPCLLAGLLCRQMQLCGSQGCSSCQACRLAMLHSLPALLPSLHHARCFL